MKFFDSLCWSVLRVPSKVRTSTIQKIGRQVGRSFFHLSPRHRRIALSNLLKAFGSEMSGEDRWRIARSSFENMALTTLEMLHFPALNTKDLINRTEFEGLDNLHKADCKKQGVLLLTAHFGNWEFLSLALSRMGFVGGALFRPFDFKPLDDYITSIRTSTGVRLIPKNRSMRKVLAMLHRGELIGILLDQNTIIREGVFVDFFGRSACTDKGLALLALKTGAPVVPVFCLRTEDGRFKIIIQPEVELQRNGDKTKEIEDNTALFTRVIENIIRAYPEQWLWLHQRWKQRPYEIWPRVQKAGIRTRILKHPWTQIALDRS
jgi:Kdo2-lipid IVA lauroyltransferase/acyltransferase